MSALDTAKRIIQLDQEPDDLIDLCKAFIALTDENDQITQDIISKHSLLCTSRLNLRKVEQFIKDQIEDFHVLIKQAIDESRKATAKRMKDQLRNSQYILDFVESLIHKNKETSL